MKKKTIILLLVMGLFLFVGQKSDAIILTRMEGEIYAEVGANYSGAWSDSATGWGASDGVYTLDEFFDDSTGIGAYGYAIGNESVSPHDTTFSLSTMVQSSNGTTGNAFETYALVRSGSSVGDRIKFMATAEAGEEGMAVELNADAFLAGSINSTGLTFYSALFESGTATTSFIFKVYKESAVDPFMKITYDDTVTNDSAFMTKSVSMPGYLESVSDSSNIHANEIFEVEFEQVVVASVTSSWQCGASAYVHSIDGVTINLTASAIPMSDSPAPAPVPEPASFLMLGIGLIGVGLLDKIKRIFPKKSFKA